MADKFPCFNRTISDKNQCGGGWGYPCKHCRDYMYPKEFPDDRPQYARTNNLLQFMEAGITLYYEAPEGWHIRKYFETEAARNKWVSKQGPNLDIRFEHEGNWKGCYDK